MEGEAPPPTLLFVVGAPAVGKMTVGREIARWTGFRLFHNHMSIEPALHFFDYGHPGFIRLVEDFRAGVFEEVARSELPGLIFTFVWAFDLLEVTRTVEAYAAPFQQRGSRILYLELLCPLDERLRRNESALRLAEKPSKRDVVRSREILLEHEEQYVFTSPEEYRSRPDWLCVDNADLEPDEVAQLVIHHFDLPHGNDGMEA